MALRAATHLMGMDSCSARVRTWAKSLCSRERTAMLDQSVTPSCAETTEFSQDRLRLAGAVGNLDKLHLALAQAHPGGQIPRRGPASRDAGQCGWGGWSSCGQRWRRSGRLAASMM